MSRQQLESYLARSLTTEFDQLHSGTQAYYDLINFAARTNARIMTNCWGVGYGNALPIKYGLFDSIHNAVQDINNAYTKLGNIPPIINGAIFELVTSDVDSIWMDSTVAKTYHIPVRRFIFDSMKYVTDVSTQYATPDISRIETQMYFYYLATRFIDCGIEALHMGQIELENINDAGNIKTWDLYSKIRKYASTRNRGLVLLNANTKGLYFNGTDTLLFDYNSGPSRVAGYYTGQDSTWVSMWDYFESSFGGPGRLSYDDCSLYGKMLGGQTYLGWYADTIPYLVGLDNTLTNLCNCLTQGGCWNAYGFDEISWFCLQSEEYRNQWLCYANSQARVLDRNCYFVMPGRTLFTRIWKYYNAINGYGYNQENAIVNTWSSSYSNCQPNDVPNLHSIWNNNNGNSISLFVFPNPVSGKANIIYAAPNGNKVTIKITDALGNIVAQWQTLNNEGNQVWNTSSVEGGIYTCMASAENKAVVTFKIVVAK